jgi:hypothetical protein
MKVIQKNIFWVFLLTASRLLGQIEKDIPGTYIMTEKIGIHVVPGLSFGDVHPTSYISSVDTTITNTIILDSLQNVTFIPDTSFHFTLTANFLTDPLVKMHGKWTIENDSLFIIYTSVDSIYSFNVNALISLDTLTGSINVDEKTLPYENRISTQLDSPISRAYSIKKYGNEIYGILPYDEKREWIIYRKQ